MNTFHRHLLTAVAVASLAACSSVKLDDQAPVESRTGARSSPAPARRQRRRRQLADAGRAGRRHRARATSSTSNLPRVVYFDFDSYVVKDDYRP